jgi:hypothetical protein
MGAAPLLTVRLSCVVPFCRSTRGPRAGDAPITATSEWICGVHWRRVDRRTRARLFAARRLVAKAVRAGRAVEAAQRRAWRAWQRCRAEAIETAMGIGA